MDVLFKQRYDWGLLPYKDHVEKARSDADEKMYARNFRWMRRRRTPDRCWPWRLAREVGWLVPSPIDVRMEPIMDSEADVPEAEHAAFANATGVTTFCAPFEYSNYVVAKNLGWATFCEVDFGGRMDQMFVPIGQGGLEWRLGWEMRFPEGYFAMVLPLPESAGFEILPGLLGHRTMAKLNDAHGMSIVVRPNRVVEICRRQPVARIVMMDVESVKAAGQFETLADLTD